MPGPNPCRRRRLGRCASAAIAAAACLLLANCAVVVERDGPGETDEIVDAGKTTDTVPRDEPRSRYGNPDSYEVFGTRYHTLKSSFGFQERGIASWYGKKFHGRRTSSGEIYDMYAMTAAHKHLPLPTYVKVTNLENGRTAILRVNDRGPFHNNRVLDLSYAAALKLGVAEKGTAFVEITAVNDGSARLGAAGDQMNPAADRNSILYLQIGAFNERVNAQRLTERVSRYLPKNVWIREASNGDQSIYRVQVGPIVTVDLADQLVTTLFDLGINEHHFVTN